MISLDPSHPLATVLRTWMSIYSDPYTAMGFAAFLALSTCLPLAASTVVPDLHQKHELSESQIGQPLLPAIHEAVVTPAPSGIMFADGVRLEGLDILAKYKIEEGMPLCIDLLDINRWNKKSRIARCFKALMEYEGAAKPMLPRLKQVEQDLLKHRERKMMEPIIEQLHQMMRDIENSTNVPQLRSLKG